MSNAQSNNQSNLRLTPEEIQGIITSAQLVYKNHLLQVFLYGSRTSLSKKGGDIDLWIVLGEEPQDIQSLKRQFRIKLEDFIGVQKVDLTVSGPLPLIKESEKKHSLRLSVLLW